LRKILIERESQIGGVGKVVSREEKIFSSMAGGGGAIAGERIGDLTLVGERFPSMEQREVEKKVCKNDIECRSGEERRGDRVASTSTPIIRPRGVGGRGGTWMGGLPDSDPDRRGRRSGLRWPGSEGENVSKMVLGGEVGPGSAKGQIVDTVKLSGISFTELGISSAIDSLGILLDGL